jgi:NAD(P)-dependent dehydrogenase (short-subunit alcohol dehydrogenase family)
VGAPALLIAGAGGGIGRAVVARFARRGWRLGLAGRDKEALAGQTEAATRLGAEEVVYGGCDLAGPAAEAQLAELARRLAPLSLLVQAAGASAHGRFAAVDDEAWRRAFAVKLLGTVRLVRAARPVLVAPSPSVVLIAGQAARQPASDFVLGALNAALEHLGKSLALDLAADGIRVNVVHPGPVRTPRLAERAAARGISPQALVDRIKASLPLGALIEPDAIAEAVEYLHGAHCVTGASLSVTAGRSAYVL